MSTDSPQPAHPSQKDPLYELSVYPFSTDAAFQEGLQSIISSSHGKSPEELENIISQAKVFYFARITGHNISLESYLEWQKSHPSATPDDPTVTPGVASQAFGNISLRDEGYGNQEQLTFQRITELINTGQTHLIPNNNVIPEALNSEPPSQSILAARKKPWEEIQLNQGLTTS